MTGAWFAEGKLGIPESLFLFGALTTDDWGVGHFQGDTGSLLLILHVFEHGAGLFISADRLRGAILFQRKFDGVVSSVSGDLFHLLDLAGQNYEVFAVVLDEIGLGDAFDLD